MPAGVGGDFETRFTTIFSQQGMEFYEQLIQYIRQLKTEQEQLAEVSLKQKIVDGELIAEINRYNGYIAKAEAALKGLTKETIDQTNARKAEAGAVKENVEVNKLLEQSERDLAARAAELAKARLDAAQAERELAAFEETEAHNRQARANQQAKDVANAERQQRALNDAIELMAQHESTAAKATTTATATTTQFARSTSEAQRQSMQFGRTVYFAAQAIEDMNYGFGAVLNNIPLVTTSFLQMSGVPYESALKVAAGISIIGSGVVALQPVIGKMWEQFTGPEFSRTHSALETLERQLKTLKDTQWLVHVDRSQIDALEEQVRRAKEAMDNFSRANSGKTIVQQEAGRRMMEAVVEEAGGTDEESGARNLGSAMNAYREARPELFGDDEQFRDLQGTRAAARSAREDIASGAVRGQAAAAANERANRLEERAKKLEIALRDRDRSTIGAAIGGNETAIGVVQSFVEADPAFFAQRGVGDRFRGAIRQARRGAVNEDPDVQERLAQRTPAEKAAVEEEKKDRAERARAINQSEGDRIKQRREARREQQKAAKEENAERERLTKEGRRIEEQAQKAQAADAKKAETAHDRTVAEHARETLAAIGKDKDLAGTLDTAIAGRLGGGATAEQVQAELLPQMARRIAPTVPQDMRQEVAAKALQDRIDAMSKRGAAEGGFGGIRDALGRADMARDAKGLHQQQQDAIAGQFQANNPGATDAQALHFSKSVLNNVNRGMNIQMATIKAYQDLQAMVLRQEHQMNQMWNAFNHAQQRGQRARSALPLGRRR